ncbi:MAG: alpha/beta hydrolase [Micrococcales bacterium]|nr:alpha/beta hydrolase [Micrococcales bacterium]
MDEAQSDVGSRSPGGPIADYLMFLHGAGGSPLSWEGQVAKLPPGLPARAPWLRGLRPGGKDRFALADAAADVLMTAQLEGAQRVALVGHSLGAMVALQCALDRPEMVSHLVLVAGQARPPKAAMTLQRWALKLVPARRLADQGVSKAKLIEALGEGGQFDASGSLSQVGCPTLVVCGGRDRVNLPASRLFAAQIPGARLAIVDDAGHDVMRDAAGEFNSLLYDFIGHPRG